MEEIPISNEEFLDKFVCQEEYDNGEFCPKDVFIDGLWFRVGSVACPEAYDVFCNGREVGYVRYRHGRFWVYADFPDGLLLKEKIGDDYDGNLANKREEWLGKAAELIKKKMTNG